MQEAAEAGARAGSDPRPGRPLAARAAGAARGGWACGPRACGLTAGVPEADAEGPAGNLQPRGPPRISPLGFPEGRGDIPLRPLPRPF